jgi:hypothetical protein
VRQIKRKLFVAFSAFHSGGTLWPQLLVAGSPITFRIPLIILVQLVRAKALQLARTNFKYQTQVAVQASRALTALANWDAADLTLQARFLPLFSCRPPGVPIHQLAGGSCSSNTLTERKRRACDLFMGEIEGQIHGREVRREFVLDTSTDKRGASLRERFHAG